MWPVARSTLLVLEPARTLLGLRRPRGLAGGQVLLIGLMVAAFLVLVVARTAPSSPANGPAASPSALAVASQPPSQAPTTRPTPTVTPSASASASPALSPTPRPSESATGRGRYRVKAGDTLSGIALKLGTTVKVLKRLNDITDSGVIRPGQVLIVPGR